jgi:hypothetical protein
MEKYGMCMKSLGCERPMYEDYMYTCWQDCASKANPHALCSHPGAEDLPALDGLEDALRKRPINGTTVIVALTNAGYVDYTINLYHSMKKIGLHTALLVFSLQQEAVDKLAAAGIPSVLFDDGSPAGFYSIHDKGFSVVTTAKLKVVHLLLSRGYKVLFTDGDVVWLKDPLPFLQSAITDSPPVDAVFMCDIEKREDEKNQDVNTGFFFMRPSPRAVHLLQPERVNTILTLSKDEGRVLNDQSYVRSNILQDGVPFRTLPLKLFPNGAFWMANRVAVGGGTAAASSMLDGAFVVHFTHMEGDQKRKQMLADGLWWDADARGEREEL